MQFTITVEEIRSKDIVVKAKDYETAAATVEKMYESGAIDMRGRGTWVVASIGDKQHDFREIAKWGCM